MKGLDILLSKCRELSILFAKITFLRNPSSEVSVDVGFRRRLVSSILRVGVKKDGNG